MYIIVLILKIYFIFILKIINILVDEYSSYKYILFVYYFV